MDFQRRAVAPRRRRRPSPRRVAPRAGALRAARAARTAWRRPCGCSRGAPRGGAPSRPRPRSESFPARSFRRAPVRPGSRALRPRTPRRRGRACEASGSLHRRRVPAERERLLWPAAVQEPSALRRCPRRRCPAGRRWRAAVAPATGKRSARPGYDGAVGRQRVLDHHQLVTQPVCGADAEAPVALAVVRAPQSEEDGSGALHRGGEREPLLTIGDRRASRNVRRKRRGLDGEGERVIDQPISRAASRYHSASAGGM